MAPVLPGGSAAAALTRNVQALALAQMFGLSGLAAFVR